jgi:tetratricopeptide (TPR) repeat protein
VLEARIRASLGRALHVTGRNDDAVGEFVRAVELQPEDWRYDANLGIFYAELGAWLDPPRGLEEATACFGRAIANAPDGRKDGLRAQRKAVIAAAASAPEL